jgi:uncharacterized protein (TIGR02679 family)
MSAPGHHVAAELRTAGLTATAQQRIVLHLMEGRERPTSAIQVHDLGRGPGAGRVAHRAAQLGVPFYITLHQLMTLPLTIRGALVHVCENPAVLRRAATELGAGSAPLLCTEGRPSTAFHQLAGVVVSGGDELRYHGDFDWPGLAIASSVMRRHGARPWRMSAADYLAGVRADETGP